MTRPTPALLASKIELLETRRMSKRNRETLEIGELAILLAPGVTVVEIMDLVDLIYGRELLSSSVIDEGRPAGASFTPGRAAAADPAGPADDKPRLNAGQRALRRVNAQRRRERIVTRGG